VQAVAVLEKAHRLSAVEAPMVCSAVQAFAREQQKDRVWEEAVEP